jgi:putative hemolysin
VLRPAPVVAARASVLDALNEFKRQAAELAIVLDAQGRFAGVVTRTDLLEAIAGEFPDEGEQ